MERVIVCASCGKGGEGGPLLKVGETYRHKKCLEQVGPAAPMPSNRHMTRPKLFVAHAKLPKLTDVHA